jgi:hypothetical protein
LGLFAQASRITAPILQVRKLTHARSRKVLFFVLEKPFLKLVDSRKLFLPAGRLGCWLANENWQAEVRAWLQDRQQSTRLSELPLSDGGWLPRPPGRPGEDFRSLDSASG